MGGKIYFPRFQRIPYEVEWVVGRDVYGYARQKQRGEVTERGQRGPRAPQDLLPQLHTVPITQQRIQPCLMSVSCQELSLEKLSHGDRRHPVSLDHPPSNPVDHTSYGGTILQSQYSCHRAMGGKKIRNSASFLAT